MSEAAIRPTAAADAPAILALYQAAAGAPGRLARRPDEMSLPWVEGFLKSAAADGVAISAWSQGVAVGELHAVRMALAQFSHVLSDLTVAVHPDWQGRGIGARLFEALVVEARRMSPPIRRIELMVGEGNLGARKLYERIGFRLEGRFLQRVHLGRGDFEDDLAMGLRLD